MHDQPITTRGEFIDAVRAVLFEATGAGVRELCFCDVDFAEWPLNEPALIDRLVAWASPLRRLTLVAQHYDEVVRRHPRFVEWRRTWSHLVDARVPDTLDASDHPTLLLAGDALTLRLLDRRHWRGAVSRDAAQAVLARDEVDAILQRSTPSFAPTTLGL